MGRYPVTQAQWRAIATLTPINRELNPDPSHFKGENRPVEQVSWYDAVEFCDRLSQLTGREYRLPTEAEWEYACRGGTTTPFHFGETITTDLANYRGTDHKEYGWSGSYGQGPKGIYREETTPVGSFAIANPFGLSDMHGNVWEWCLDHWHENYEGAPTDGSAWLTEEENARRLLRGGSWYDDPRNCRSAYRTPDLPVVRDDDIGFRLVCVSPWT
jgi:formylglycine-generating enzyme required for sulfatase activity